MAQTAFVCLHQPRPSRCIPRRRSHARNLPVLCIPKKHQTFEPVLLLVGTHAGLPARLPALPQIPVELLSEKVWRDGWTVNRNMVSHCAVCGARPEEQPGRAGQLQPAHHIGAPDEAQYHQLGHLAGRLLCAVPEFSECSGRAFAIW